MTVLIVLYIICVIADVIADVFEKLLTGGKR